MIYNVYNVNGSSNRASLPAGYSSWMDFWEKKTGRKANLCKCTACMESATDGAHVNVDGYGYYWFITPLCHMHNMSNGTLQVDGPLVPVNENLPILP